MLAFSSKAQTMMADGYQKRNMSLYHTILDTLSCIIYNKLLYPEINKVIIGYKVDGNSKQYQSLRLLHWVVSSTNTVTTHHAFNDKGTQSISR